MLYQIESELVRNAQTVVYRARRVAGEVKTDADAAAPAVASTVASTVAYGADSATIILKTHQDAHAPVGWLARLRHEHEVLRVLGGIPSVAQLARESQSGLVRDGSRYMLVLEDDGARDLASYMADGPLAVDEAVTIALSVARTLAAIHQRRIVHRDINPKNIIYNRDTGYVGIIDFGIASRLPRQHTAVSDMNTRGLAGTLRYLAPEQSGRMNRSADYRADLYALGITMYEMLVGAPPFVSDDALELLHAHMAIQPEAPHHKRPGLPRPLSQLVMRLLQKMPERRYQSGEGLAADLAMLAKRLHTPHPASETGAAPACGGRPNVVDDGGDQFVLGRFDIADRLQIPERLYGRAPQIVDLEAAWAHTVQGASSLSLVAGPSGLGKSALVRELKRSVAAARGWMLAGKCERMTGDVPYRPIAQALHDLSEQLLRAPETTLRPWRARIQQAVAPYGGVLVALVPNLSYVLGDTEAVEALSAQEAKQRFFHVCARFFAACTGPEQPLLVCLDDLQWADHASLQLVHFLLADVGVRHLAIVGTYRDDEVDEGHPLWALHEQLSARSDVDAALSVIEVRLSPLTRDEIAELLADTLLQSTGAEHTPAISALADLCHRHSQGNPFVVREFLAQWHDDGLIHIARAADGAPYWAWELAELARSDVTEEVAALMTKRLARLSPGALDALAHAACIGNRASLSLVATAMDAPIADCARLMQEATAQELLLMDARGDRALALLIQAAHSGRDEASLGAATSEIALDDIEFRFRHDRIRAAAYEHLPAAVRMGVHWRVARRLRQGIDEEQDDAALFELLLHYNQVRELVDDADERQQIARYNLSGAERAISAAAYRVAVDYCRIGVDMLGPHGWRRQYAMTMALHRTWAIATLMVEDDDACERIVGRALEHCKDGIERAQLRAIRIEKMVRRSEFGPQIVETTMRALVDLGIAAHGSGDKQAAIHAIEADLGPGWADGLIANPIPLVDRVSLRLDVFASLVKVAMMGLYFSELGAWRLVGLQSIQLFRSGATASIAAYTYMTAAMTMATDGQYRRAYALAQAAIDNVRQTRVPGTMCERVSAMAGFVLHWGVPLRSLTPLYEEAREDGRGVGQHVWLANLSLSEQVQHFYAGVDLPQLKQSIAVSRKQGLLQYLRFYHSIATIMEAAIACLRGQTSSPTAMHIDNWSEEAFLCEDSPHKRASAGYYWAIKAQLCTLYGDFQEAEAAARTAGTELKGAGQFVMIARTFYHLLSHIGQCAAMPHDHNNDDGTAVPAQGPNRALWDEGMAKLTEWAEIAPQNCRHYLLVLQAEYMRVSGQCWKAVERYHQAIKAAHAHGFVQDEGLIQERLARHFIAMDDLGYACIHFEYALKAFASWGAKAKAAALRRELTAFLKARAAQREFAHTTTDESSDLDGGGGPKPYRPEVQALARGTHGAHGAHATHATLDQDSDVANQLELGTVLKASHAIAGQLKLEDLTQRLLQVTLEAAGAERGCLLRPRDNNAWHVELEAESAQVFHAQPLDIALEHSGAHLPVTAVDYVRRTHRELVLGNATDSAQYAKDDYVLDHDVKSLLCIPIVTEDRPLAMLYLENRFTAEAFSPKRVALMRILAAQAAISFENAHLFAELQDINAELEARVERRTRQLKEAQAELLAQAHRAGRAELAIDTVHNIGNALNSVRVNGSYINELLAAPAAARYQRANALLSSHRQDLASFFTRDPRGPKLVDFYQRVDRAWQSQHDEMLESNRELLSQIDVIAKVVQAQRAYTESEEHTQTVSLMHVLEEVLRMNQHPFAEAGITATVATAPTEVWVDVNPMRLRYVLIELCNNARDAIVANGPERGPGTIHVTVECGDEAGVGGGDDGGERGRARVRICDSGIGLEPDVLARVFERGFSTKPRHRGFGLHNAANYIKRIGGQLQLLSEGAGRGAIAVVELARAPRPGAMPET